MEGLPCVVLDPSTVVKQEAFADETDEKIVLKEEFMPDDSWYPNKSVATGSSMNHTVKSELTHDEDPDCLPGFSADKFCPSSNIHIVIKEEIDVVEENSFPAEQVLSNNIRKTIDKTGQCRSEDCLADVTCMSSTDPVISKELDAFGKTRNDVMCDKCSKTFPNLITLKRDKLLQCSVKQYQCGVCKKSFSQPSSLSSHRLVRNDIRNKNSESDTCEENFALKHQLVAYAAVVHTDVENYLCVICNKVFTTLRSLNRHKVRHMKKHICDICNKAFSSKQYLSKHKIIHSGIQKYFCDICSKAFTDSSNLNRHKIIHIGLKKYFCDICNKAFTYKPYLNKHKIRHSGIKNYFCDICNKAFTSKQYLSKHKIIMHSDIKKYFCDICNKAFTTFHALHRHKVRQWHEKI